MTILKYWLSFISLHLEIMSEVPIMCQILCRLLIIWQLTILVSMEVIKILVWQLTRQIVTQLRSVELVNKEQDSILLEVVDLDILDTSIINLHSMEMNQVSTIQHQKEWEVTIILCLNLVLESLIHNSNIESAYLKDWKM